MGGYIGRRRRRGACGFWVGQRGQAFVEILTGLAILAAVAVTYLSGMSTVFKATGICQEIVYTESLAKSQIEDIKTQNYILVDDYNPDDPANRYEPIDIPANLTAAGYSLEINSPQLVSGGAGQVELQSITVVIKRHGQGEFSVTIYRVSE